MAAIMSLNMPLAFAEPGDPPPPGLGIGMLDIPAYQQGDPRAANAMVDAALPGATVVRTFRVSNLTGEARPVDVYVGPARIEPQPKGFTDLPRGEQNELTAWSSVDKSRMDMALNEQQTITLTIKVPDDATEGERYAVLWAEMEGTNPDALAGVRLVNRVGIRIYFSVGPGNGPTPTFQIDSLTPLKNAQGHHEVVVGVTNTGQRAVDLRAAVTLTAGPGGLSMDERVSPGTTLAIGESGDLVINLGVGLPAGQWHAFVTVRHGLIVETAEADLNFPESGTGATVAIDNSTGADIPWVWMGAALGAGALLALLIVLLLSRRRKQSAHSQS